METGIVRDPVCGMDFNPALAIAVVTFEGAEYHLCSVACQRQFERYPEYFHTAARASKPREASADANH